MKIMVIGKVFCKLIVGNLNEIAVVDPQLDKKKELVQKMKEESSDLDHELENLEKDYLAKVAKLLIMAQVHSEVKSDINHVFDDLGIAEDEGQEEEQ